MSGLEVVIVVGGAIYITKKVRERKERKRLERNATAELNGEHGVPQLAEVPAQSSGSVRLRQQVPLEEEDPLPVYRAPTHPLPSSGAPPEWSTSLHLPTYDEVSKDRTDKEFEDGSAFRTRSNDESSSSSSSTPLASPTGTHLAPPALNELPSNQSAEKKRRFWRRSSSSKAVAE